MGLINTTKLTVIFAVMVALFATMGYLFYGTGGLIMGLVFAGLMNFVTYFYSDRIVLKMHRAKPLDTAQHGDLHDMVDRLAGDAGVPAPDLYLMQESTPNAFATGRNPDNAVVCVTQGLLDNLSTEEIEGVLAHELAHVKNRDTLIQAVAGTFAGAISMLAQMLWFSSLTEENQNPLFMFGGMLLAPIAATILKMAISRSREYTADATAAQYTDPLHLARALGTIEQYASQRPMQHGAKGASHLFIVNPFRGDALAKLLSTHPPTEDRIQRLKELSEQ